MNMKKKLPLSKFEIVWYSICTAFALWGLTYIILGLIAQNLAVPASKNYLAQASEALASVFGLGFFGWGLIILGVSAVAASIVLLVNAKKTDRDYEKAQRRAARLARTTFGEETPEVVDAKSEPVQE